jgi:hypothetical protein
MRISNRKLLATALVAGLTFGTSAANATLLIEYSLNGGAFTTAYSGSASSVPFTGSPGSGVSITVGQVTTNSPGTPNSGTVTGGTFGITNTSATTESLVVVIGSSGFTMPTNPGQLAGSISITDNGSVGGSTVTEYACAFSTSTVGACPTSGTYAKTSTNTVMDVGNAFSVSGNSSANAPSLTTPYEIADVVSLTLVAGANFAVTTAATVTVPEPASIALLGFGLLGLASFARRRSNTQA